MPTLCKTFLASSGKGTSVCRSCKKLPLQVDQERKGERHAVELVKFNDLEEKIRNIIEEYTVLKGRNQELEDSLKNRDAEQEDLKNTIRKLNEERDAVRTKVDSLLVMLQNIQL